jgi:hypothetical protein
LEISNSVFRRFWLDKPEQQNYCFCWSGLSKRAVQLIQRQQAKLFTVADFKEVKVKTSWKSATVCFVGSG